VLALDLKTNLRYGGQNVDTTVDAALLEARATKRIFSDTVEIAS
jgi:hypothetical protein